MKSLAARASVIPGGSLTRSKKIFGDWAVASLGARIKGVEHSDYVDMLCALGAVSLGNGNGVLSLPHMVEVEAAEAVLTHVAPWASHVRFTATGSEATHAAYRIAKKATGRTQILMGDWAYHGWHEWCQGGRDVSTFKHGASLWDDWQGDNLAAVFIEPNRWELVDPLWLQKIRAFCDRVGALLVFDSMIWGGRMALGGTSQYFGIKPDLECYGKAFGNGLPVAFVVGNEALKEHGEIVSGTYSGYPAGLQAVVDTIHTYTTEPVTETLWTRGRQLQNGLRHVIPSDLGVCEGLPVHQRVRFFNEAHGPAFTQAMKARGILWHYACANVMYSHTEAQIDRVIQAAAEIVRCL